MGMLETVNGEAGGKAPGVTPGFRQGKGMKARLWETAWLQAGCGVLKDGLGWKVGEGNGR